MRGSNLRDSALRMKAILTFSSPSLPLLFVVMVGMLALTLVQAGCHQAYDPASPGAMPPEHPVPARALALKEVKLPDLRKQTKEEKEAKSKGCLASNCHAGIEAPDTHDGMPRDTRDMHNGSEPIGCTDCHGGNAQTVKKEEAHI